jgi:small subunit ribosomal protein S14
MAKLSLINREAKRMRTVQKYASKRAALKAKISNQGLSAEECLEAMRSSPWFLQKIRSRP